MEKERKEGGEEKHPLKPNHLSTMHARVHYWKEDGEALPTLSERRCLEVERGRTHRLKGARIAHSLASARTFFNNIYSIQKTKSPPLYFFITKKNKYEKMKIPLDTNLTIHAWN
jgi:hypothetical protein